MVPESYNLIRYKYEIGIYSLKEMIELVDLGWITKKQFHQITSYSYDGVKEIKGLT